MILHTIVAWVLPFHSYDVGKDGFIDLFELKLMMEKLEAPQTHLGLKAMIKEVDEDFDDKISFREVSMYQVSSFSALKSLILPVTWILFLNQNSRKILFFAESVAQKNSVSLLYKYSLLSMAST